MKTLFNILLSPKNNNQFSNNIFSISSTNQTWIIDTGFIEEARMVLNDLKKEPMSVIISHFHMDHMGGLPLLQDKTTYGSDLYLETLNLWYANLRHQEYEPKFKIHNKSTIVFDHMELIIEKWPGHSACNLITIINGDYLHIADEVMYSLDGKLLIPGLDGINFIDRNISSLEKLAKIDCQYVLFGHGDMKTHSEFIEDLHEY